MLNNLGGEAPKMAYVEKLRERMEEASVDALMVGDPLNWRFLSGFTGDAGTLLITASERMVFTDSRYTEQAKTEAPDWTVVKTLVERDVLKEVVADLGVKAIAFEKDYLTYAAWERLRDRFAGLDLLGVSGWIEELRAVKSKEEIERIQEAQKVTDKAFEWLLPSIKEGVREIDLALKLEFKMRRLGSEGVAFPFIVVSGERSSLPHGAPSEKELTKGDFVTLDFGARCGGYCSDMTRTLVVGPASDRHRKMYDAVLKAQVTALETVKPGILAKTVDLAGRKVLEDAGYGEYFGHGIGHGVGLNVHERPSVGKRSDALLEPGMVITIEPGIYIPGFGGVRIEDLVLVTEKGRKNLTESPKQLIVV